MNYAVRAGVGILVWKAAGACLGLGLGQAPYYDQRKTGTGNSQQVMDTLDNPCNIYVLYHLASVVCRPKCPGRPWPPGRTVAGTS